MNKRKTERIISLILCAAMVLCSGCTLPGTYRADDNILESTEGVDLTMAEAADNIFSLNCNTKYSFNPLIATNHSNQLVAALVYENMVELDNNFEVIPNVITDWKYNDSATTWEFTVATDHVFHDGTPVTAKDLRYSLDKAINSDRFRGRFASYQGADYWGEDKLTVNIGIGDTQFVKLLNIPIIKSGTFDDKFPTGSGPYSLEYETVTTVTGEGENAKTKESYKPVQLNAFEQHPDYKKLPVDTVYLKEYTQAEDIINAFEDSYIDVVINDPSSYTNLGYASTNEIHTYATTNMHYIGFNQETTLGSMAGVRYALQYAFDRAYLVELLKNNAVASAVPMYPTCADYPTEFANSLAQDMDKCKTILENNGIRDYDDDGFMEMMNGSSDDLEINFILCSDSSAKAGIANRFAEDMLTIGIKVNVLELTWDDYYNALTDYENLTKEQKEDEDFRKVEFDMYYAETKLRNNFDITEIIQPRTDRTKATSINFTKSIDMGYETYMYNYLASGDSSRKNSYKALCEYVLTSSASIVVIGFEKQQIITHRGAVRGVDANAGNPLYNFQNWEIHFKSEENQ